ncbi:MAG: PEP-CTERM sorting domain-containing protein [Desulfobaccales bacterium]
MRRKLALILFAMVLSASGIGPVGASTYHVYDDWGGTWHDADKAWTDDTLMCWAAAAANILDWAGWDTAPLNNQTMIFQYFVAHWTNQGSFPEFGWNWWLDGTLPPSLGPEWFRIDIPGGNFWPSANFDNLYHEAWSGNLLADIDSFLHSGYGVTLAIYKSNPAGGLNGHALTCWGYEYSDGSGGRQYAGVYVTDSDDHETALQYYTVSWDNADKVWDLGGGFNGWYIGGIEALGQNVPLPPSMLLFASGLLVLAAWRRRTRSACLSAATGARWRPKK